jgi:hypothetical protein
MVDQDTVKAGEDRRVLLVGPGELAVQERDLKEAKGVYKVIKGGGFGGVDGTIGLIPRGADEVEISQESNRTCERGKDLLKRGKETGFEGMSARSVDIDNGEQKVVGAMGEGGGDREIVNGVMGKIEHPVIPGRKNPA